MRVLFLTHSYPRFPGDYAGHFLHALARGLHERGVSVVTLCPHGPDLPEWGELEGVEIRRFRYAPSRWERLAYRGELLRARGQPWQWALLANFAVAFARSALELVKTREIDLLHAHWWVPAGLAGAWTTTRGRPPLVLSLHGTDVHLLRHRPWRALARWVLTRASAVTAVSRYLCDEVHRSLGGAQVLLPLPLPVAFPPQEWQPRTSPWPWPRPLVAVARLTPQKRLHVLVEAMGLLKRRGLAVRLTLAGEGPCRERLEAQARRLGVEEEVRFLGAVPPSEVSRLLADGYCSVLPSVGEGFGMVVVESLLWGCPVVASASGALLEVVKHAETGLLVPPDDPTALATALERLCRSPELRDRLAVEGQVWARARFEPEALLDQYLTLYHQVMGERGRPG